MSTPTLTPEEQTLCNNVLRLLESGDTVTRFQAIGVIRDHVAAKVEEVLAKRAAAPWKGVSVESFMQEMRGEYEPITSAARKQEAEAARRIETFFGTIEKGGAAT